VELFFIAALTQSNAKSINAKVTRTSSYMIQHIRLPQNATY